jgi:quercetin dioxygenase-like cupin family protein
MMAEMEQHQSPAKKLRLLDSSNKEMNSKDQVEVVKTTDMVERDTALLDSFICGFQRTTTLFFGRIVSNPSDLPTFKDWLGYSMTYNRVPAGNGNALHLHNSVEIFVAMDGPFEIGYGTKGQHSAVLQPMDFVACPAGVYHYYKNIDPSKQAQILTILPGRPTVTWSPDVVQEARKKGAICDDKGVLSMKDATMRMDAPEMEEKIFLEGDINPFVMKHSDKQALYLATPDGASWIQLGWKDLAEGESVDVSGELPRGPVMTVRSEDPHDVLVVILRGSVQVTVGSTVKETLGKLDMFKLPKAASLSKFTGLANTTLLVVRSHLPQHFDFFFNPKTGISTSLGRLPSSLMN